MSASLARILFAGVLAFCALLCSSAQAPRTIIQVNPADTGRTFDGIGAVSAGASSRLLIDYPEPQRSQILDYLFKPNYGASIQHLKVEIGGDGNSTDGSEPSHMHSREDANFQRGYEWWLMKEARKRNPRIILDTLAWSAPGWIGDGKYYSQDMADYVVRFLEGAKKVHGLDIEFTGVWNEKKHDGPWVKSLRKALDAKGFSDVKIVAADLYGKEEWEILRDMQNDPELDKAIFAVGVHYPHQYEKGISPGWVKESGRRLWSTEDQPALTDNAGLPVIGSREWVPGGKSLAKLLNRNYILGRLTKTEIWSPITSYYDNLAAPNSGLMYANTPWSGHYNVQPTIWVMAHTSQFTQPGWQYLDRGCGLLPGEGSYVTLRPPDSSDYTVVVETIDAHAPQEVELQVSGPFAGKPVHVWRTDAATRFTHQEDLAVRNGVLTANLQPGAIYTFSTTAGQGKGTAESPASRPLTLPYSENFDDVAPGRTPKYLADQNGAFEAVKCEGREGLCLTQVVNTHPISWGIDVDPYTYMGEDKWTDYEVAVDVRLSGPGHVSLMGRIDSSDYFLDGKMRWPSGYILTFNDSGRWELFSAAYRKQIVPIASGTTSPIKGSWHRLSLEFRASQITARLDGDTLTSKPDGSHLHGMAGFGTGWNRAQFDKFAIHKLSLP